MKAAERAKRAVHDLERYVAKGDRPCVAHLRAESRPGSYVKLTPEGLQWALTRMAKGSDLVKDWSIEAV